MKVRQSVWLLMLGYGEGHGLHGSFLVLLHKERLMKWAALLYQRTLFRRRLEASSDVSFAVNYTVEEVCSLRVSWERTLEKLLPVLEPNNALKTLQIRR